MEKQTWFVLLLAVLVLVALVQAFQLTGLKDKIVGGSIATASKSVTPQAGSSQPAKTQSGIDNLPSMVGGC